MDHAIVYHTDTVSKQIQSLKHQHTHTLMHASVHSDTHTYGHTPWYTSIYIARWIILKMSLSFAYNLHSYQHTAKQTVQCLSSSLVTGEKLSPKLHSFLFQKIVYCKKAICCTHTCVQSPAHGVHGQCAGC